ncbi:MAG: hypothetical protein CMJ78_19655 [Planctomycetaceae bacterium]|nr:hypothetical protein [Planctomycetaceae bacterium]
MTTGPNKECGTLFLATLSSASLISARVASVDSVTVLMATSAFFLGLPWLVWAAMRTVRSPTKRFDRFLALGVAIWVLTPLGLELIARSFGYGESLEIVMLVFVQHAAITAAVFSHRHRCQQFACLLSSFVALFAVVIDETLAVFVFAGMFGVSMLWWLMARYWERVRQTVNAEHSDRCLPVRSSVLAGVMLILLLLAVTLGTTRASTRALRGFMPTSGGDRWSDDFARSGVGDGDAMVAAKDQAMSFGPVESELFLDSEMPTLYDMFNDLYGDPLPTPKKSERAIGLNNVTVKDIEQRVAKTERNGREFSVLRRQAKGRQKTLDDRRAAAMFYVIGRVPLHLALERFDTFDGREWTHSEKPTKQAPIQLETINDKPWAFFMAKGASSIHRGWEPHAIKLINLKTNRFPSPPQFSAVHVDRVDRLDFFGWTDDDVACMPPRKQIPQLTVMHIRSQGVNLESLRNESYHVHAGSQTISASRHVIAHDWTRNVPRGWRQVEAVVDRLRTGFTCDPQAAAPEDCDDVIAHFLETRRGPDFLFATTAAGLLRELNYKTRLVTGFYAREDRYDRQSRQTSVLADDVHAWVEVQVDGRTWIAIEPTPGYEPPPEALTWRQRLAMAGHATWRWLVSNSILLTLALAFAGLLWITRVVWLDGILAVVCWGAGCGSPRRRVLWTLRLLEWRAWLVGYTRPQTAALSSWYSSLISILPQETSNSLRASLRFAECCLYGPSDRQISSLQTGEVTAVCSIVRREVNARCFQRAIDDQSEAKVERYRLND